MILFFHSFSSFHSSILFPKPLPRLLLLWNENKTHGNKKEKILIPNIISSSINIGSDNNNSIIVITSNTTTPAAATTTANNTTTTSLPSGIELTSQPVYQEQEKLESQIPNKPYSFTGDRLWKWNADFAKWHRDPQNN
jgi:hypothetical protein